MTDLSTLLSIGFLLISVSFLTASLYHQRRRKPLKVPAKSLPIPSASSAAHNGTFGARTVRAETYHHKN